MIIHPGALVALQTYKENTMSEDAKNEELAKKIDAKLKKADAADGGKEVDQKLSYNEMCAKLDAAMAKIDAMCAKKDAEGEEKDPEDVEAEKLVADRKRAKADAVFSAEHSDAIASAYLRADSVYSIWGMSPPKAMSGETVRDYEARLARPLQKYSKEFGAVDLRKLDDATFAGVKSRIYADAVTESHNPDLYTEGLREIQTRDQTGRMIT
jgi:hypothetical protein